MWKHIFLLAVGITLASSATLYFKPLPKKQDVTLKDLMKIWAEKTAQNKQKTPLGSVSCQDGSDCPSSSTCCTMGNGHYGCCPLSHAVCCSDQIHCCPKDTTCDVKEGHCLKHDGSKVLWTQKTETQSVSSKNQVCPDGKTCPDGADCCVTTPGHYGCCFGEHQAPAKPVEEVVCPDGTSECADGETCCKLSTGEYGCCPLPNAVCCADHLHCCPSGTTCDTAQGKCNRQDGTSVMWFTKTSAKKSVSVESVTCPDGASQCPDGSTCCVLGSGQYGCCPLPKAVCCSDRIHCCPSGTTCDTSQGKCNRQDGTSILWSEKTPAKSVSVEDVVCPDGQSQCPDGSTCCKLSSGQYGCCPLPNAVCCADHLHCCPSGTTCDTAQGKCNRQDGTSILWSEKTPAKSVSVEDVVCPDGQSQCPDGSTCCKLSSGQYGCCPLPNAVCCADHLHCCPSGTTCDTAQGKCNRQDGTSILWSEKTPAKSVSVEDVVCPDGQSQCPDGSTCCKLSSGQYGCCPLPNAVCCADHLHCCPSGTTCDTAQGKCNRQDGTSVMWFTKTSAKKSVSVESVMCPDGQSQCPDGSTCCKLSSGQYGCCPLPNAVCCADHLHCCPSGTTCDTAQGKCNRQDGTSILWSEKTPAKSVSVEDVVCPDGQSQCPDGSTCCKLSSGQYGCCPLPNAVCCADHLHCCPSGTTCDTSQGKCNRQDGTSVMWFTKTSAKKSVSVESVMCPDGQSQCPDGSTCCKLSSGQYGCCPLPNAVCCADHLHCCPSGTTCDTAQGKCNRQDGTSILWSEKTPAKSVSVEDVVCPDGQSQCPDGSTCCKLSSGQYGCCPLPNAVCCADHLHCCPSGTTCDTSQGKCNRQDGTSILWSEKTPAKSVSVEDVVCPDGQSQCPDGSTCCKLSSGQYGCCPLPNAVCCADHLHCCPSGTTCDTAQGKCNRQDGTSVLWSEKTPAKSVSVKDVVCPDGQSQCPDGSTCCKLSSGQYGCCPLPNAVCCADHLHCCPSGTTCDTAQGKCNRQDGTSVLWSEKTPAKSVSVKDVVCPDGQSQCPDGSTCCKLSSGQYGCCPLPNAVCCADHLHCCPSGTTCDTAQGKCNRQDGTSVLWSEKTPAKSVSVKDVVCPDGQSQCPDGSTCCKLSSGQYGCCPLPNAVCCADHLHCCPSGTTCDTAQGKCNRQDGTSILWSEKTSAKSVSVEDVVCPDGQSQCPDNSSCCKLSSGQYGCCPLPNAVCCADHLHCCPSGTTCDTAQGKCNRQDGTSILWSEKTPAKSVSVKDVVCPDGQSQCPDGSTCCKLSSGQYGCCPLPNAVCCADHLHCCPSGTTCDTAQGKCNRQDGTSILWSEKTPAKSVSVEDVVCPDGQSQCPDGSTCCKLSSGQYGCCPLPNAVCCADHLHCCPSGTTCDTAQGKCNRQDGTSILWSEKTPAKSVSVEDVVCPDGQSQCPDGSTCCKLSSGQYGCCPLPNAVCCADHLHCCPSGTTCDTAQGKCNRQDGTSILWSEKTPAKSVSVEDVVCPDGQSQCPDGSTCCKLSSGQYGCCPLPNAVCCADHLHCCPSGTTCDTAQGKCNRQDGTSILWSEKTPAKSVSVEDVVCPDGQSQCPDGSTCCKLSSGQYGCCPLPNAVCCADHLHCCPSGTTCDTAQGKCNRQDGTSILWSEKTPAKSVSVEDVVCPDGQSQCPDGSTCCKLSSGQYGCCPLPNAVCCADHLHCCPSGTTCDTAQGKCNRQDGTSILWSEKTPAKSVSVEDVVCPDGQSQCPDGSTCCKLSSGQYGCCPLPNAVCCADHLHCCPSGTTCDTSQGKCNRQDGTSILWSEKTPAKSVSVEDVVCPDGQSQCPDGSTCCKLSSGQYGCCPLPNAVCCADHLHCCPSGTTCDTAQGKCNRQDGTSILWSEKTPAKSVSVEDVVCPDGQSQCPDGSTCCKLSSGQYGCCPLPNAVCCADHLHCCPSGTTCDTAQGKCNRQDGTSVMWFTKTSAKKSVSINDVMCPGGASQCPDGSTCCLLQSGQYGCCPYPKAVCCSDKLHCCPSGTTCDVAAGSCNRQDGTSILWSEKTPAKSASVEDVVCPDGQSQCPDGSTCCKLSSGQYGCCPLPNAVCCADHLHCCPSGTTCDTAQGKCNRQDGTSVMWFTKTSAQKSGTAIQKEEVNHVDEDYSVMCPDGHSQCPDGETCCKLYSGDYGCCPLPDAVCCSDEIHCCPAGFTCDVGKQQCTDSQTSSDMVKHRPAKQSFECCGTKCCPSGYKCTRSGLCEKLPNADWKLFKNGF